jgi:DNA-binding CsgD family transcriptional regulator
MRSLPGAPAAILWVIQPSGPLTHGSVREQLLEDGLRRIGGELDRLGLRRAAADASGMVLSFDGIDRLSPRELDVVGLLLEGHRVVSIAAELGVSEHTIRNHLKSIFRKLGIHSQAELVSHARADSII